MRVAIKIFKKYFNIRSVYPPILKLFLRDWGLLGGSNFSQNLKNNEIFEKKITMF